MMEPAVSHPTHAGSDPELCLQRETTMLKAGSKLAASSEYLTSENLENSSGSAQFLYSDNFFTH